MYTTMIRRRNLVAVTLALFCLCILPLSAQEDFPFRSKEAAFGPDAVLSDFTRRSLAEFSTFALSNGIPVIVKRNDANRIQHLSLVIRGGSLLADPAMAGLESLCLATMARASTGHSYKDIQALLDETSSGMGSASSFEYSSYSLNTLDKYFPKLFPVWAETLVSPALLASDFDQVLSEAKLALKSKEQNPWSKTGLVTNAEFLAGHPYSISPDGTKESLGRITLAAVKDWYGTQFAAERMFVVAVGNFDAVALRAELEASLGTIARRSLALPGMPAALAGPGASRLVKSEYPQSKGIGYIRGDFPAPAPGDADFMPMNIAMKMLSDLLFNVMRDKYGATYSPSSYIRSFSANYGSLVVYKTKVAAKAKAYLDEAVASLARGECMSVDPTFSDGPEPRMSVEAALPVYKALFKNSYYESQETNGAIASRIAASVIESGDYRSYLLDTDRVDAVTAPQIRFAFDKYILGGKFIWVVLGSKDVVQPVAEADYEGFAR